MRAARVVPICLFVALASGVGITSSFAQVGPAPSAGRVAPRANTHAQIVLVKGLAGIFSSGMIDLGEKLKRQGIEARVESHADSEALSEDIARRYESGVRGPIIIVGHSLGADVAGGIARRLNEHQIPVALLVTFGPISDPLVTPNVAQAINYYQAMSAWRGRMIAAPGFHGSLTNIDLEDAPGINHFNIEKSDRLHADTIAKISAILGRSRAQSH